MLLAPFGIRHLRTTHVGPLAAVAKAYGPAWTEQLVDTWTREISPDGHAHIPSDTAWVKRLPDLCRRLYAMGTSSGSIAVALLARTWRALSSTIDATLRHEKAPSQRTASLARTGPSLAALLLAAERAQASALRDAVLTHLTALASEATPLLLAVLRELAALPAAERGDGSYARMAKDCSRRLRAELAAPTRTKDDWSIPLPDKCGCALCRELAAFLSSPNRTTLIWPLAKENRHHIHSRIDVAELPVTHVTLREGRPYKLVLTKTDALFTRERDRRAKAQADLAWIGESN